jgi:hypothetical protein
VGLDPLARFAREYKKRPIIVELIAHSSNRSRIGAVEKKKSLRALRRSSLSNRLRRQIRISHRNKNQIAKSLALSCRGQRRRSHHVRPDVIRQVKPIQIIRNEPLLPLRIRPQRVVLFPKALYSSRGRQLLHLAPPCFFDCFR